jgi:hypothetical protein
VVNGAARSLADGALIAESTGVQIVRHGSVYIVTDDNGNSVTATIYPQWISLSVGLGHSLTQIRGLLGNPKGTEQVLATSAGVVLNEPVTFTDLYHAYADSWRVQPKDSLFTEPVTIPAGIPAAPFYASEIDPQLSGPAFTACREAGITNENLLESCVLDSVVMNDKLAIKAFVLARPPIRIIKPVLNLEPVKR